MFGGQEKLILKGFCDADWAGQPHRHSISGYSFHMGGIRDDFRISCPSHRNQVSLWIVKFTVLAQGVII